MDHLKGLQCGDELQPKLYEKNIYEPERTVTAKEIYLLPEDATDEQKDAIITYDFHDFPEKRAGWELDENFQFTPIKGMRVVPFKTFLQSWLFFGLLKTVIQLGDENAIKLDEFRRPPINYTVQTTELERYLNLWAERENNPAYKNGQTLRMIRAQVALDKARKVVLAYCSVDGSMYQDNVNSPTFVDELLALSLMVLGETLTAAKSKIVHKVGFNIKGWHGDANEGWGTPNILLRQMLQDDKWCPRTVYMLKGQLRSHATSLLSAYKINKDLSTRGQQHQDEKCTEQKCNVVYAERTGEYKTQHYLHCTKGNECKLRSPDMSSVISALEDGTFPLFSCNETDGNINITTIPFEQHAIYATVSHVWADGYGNLDKNELWECQLGFFKKLFETSELDKSGRLLFWIDTLAIPVGKDPQQKQARKTAIKKIHNVFTIAIYS